jgi:hypothetical protein
MQTLGLIRTTFVNISALLGVARELSQRGRHKRSERIRELEQLLQHGQLTVCEEQLSAQHVLLQLVRTDVIENAISQDWHEKARHACGFLFLFSAGLLNLVTFTITYPAHIPAWLLPLVDTVTGVPADLHHPPSARQHLALFISFVLLWSSFSAVMRLGVWRQFSISYYVYAQQMLPLSVGAVCSHRWLTHPAFIGMQAYIATASSLERGNGYMPPMLDHEFARHFAVEYGDLVVQRRDSYRTLSVLTKFLDCMYVPPSKLKYGLPEDRFLATTINTLSRRADKRARPRLASPAQTAAACHRDTEAVEAVRS